MKVLRNVTRWSAGLSLAVAMMSSAVYAQDDAPQLTDPEIASVAVAANQVDIDYASIALKKSENKDIKHFATTMANDHKSIIKQAVDLVTKLGVTPKDNDVTQSLQKGQKETAAKLNKLKGKAFDKAYIDNEVTYHESVINVVKTILIPQADNKELKDLLKNVVPLLDHHLEMAKKVQAEFK